MSEASPRAALAILILVLLFTLWSCKSTNREEASTVETTPRPEADPLCLFGNRLALDDVFAWRSKYADLLGKSSDTVLERYGQPKPQSEEDLLKYEPSPKTDNRGVYFILRGKKVSGVKLFASKDDCLPVEEVVKKAPLFTFESGTFKDHPKNYFVAETLDKRNAIQFEVSDVGVKFVAAMFSLRE